MVKKKVLFLVNHDLTIYNFRKEIVERLLKENYEVIISSPDGERIQSLIDMGCTFENISIDRRGVNPLKDLQLIFEYSKLIRKVKPNIILSFTIKPNIYGAIASRWNNVPFIANITGLGNAVDSDGILQKITVLLYKYAFFKVDTVFFQNKSNLQFFKNKRIKINESKLIPGSGVNLEEFKLQNYTDTEKLNFIFIARVMKEKGIDEYIEADKQISKKYQNTEFHICGFCEDNYESELENLSELGIIKYHGMVNDLSRIYGMAHCIINPSYREGMSNVLLEASASGRPVIASNIPGCIETFDEGRTGFGFEVKNTESLREAIEKFINLPYDEKKKMGILARSKMEKDFDRQIVVTEYINKISEIVGANENEFI